MISIIQETKHSVIRLSSYDQKTNSYKGERLIGTYATLNEANFIAKKAEKMEKAAILSNKLLENPKLTGKLKLNDIVLGDVKYNVTAAVDKVLSPRYTNGVSNVVHHMKEMNPHEKRLEKVEQNSNSFLSFQEFVKLRESNALLRTKMCKHWTSQDLGISNERNNEEEA